MIAAFDPGFTGAVAFLNDPMTIAHLEDMPVLKDGKRTELNEARIKELLVSYQPSHVMIEKAQAMPSKRKNSEGETESVPQGAASTARYMASYGLLRGICVGLGIRYTLVHPATWKAALMKDMPKGKEASIIRAQQLFPGLVLPRKKDHGKADAILIALYGLTVAHVQ